MQIGASVSLEFSKFSEGNKDFSCNGKKLVTEVENIARITNLAKENTIKVTKAQRALCKP